MPEMHIVLDGDGAFQHLRDAHGEPIEVLETDGIIVAALIAGMASGRPSVAFAMLLPPDSDGAQRWVFAQTSMRLFVTAADAFRARFGDAL